MNKLRLLPIYAALLVMSSAAVACSSCERAEEVKAEVLAAQMEGRRAAAKFVNRPWRDTVELQHQLLEAKAKQSRYLIDNQPECAEAFDSAFIRTIRVVRPELAKDIQNKQ